MQIPTIKHPRYPEFRILTQSVWIQGLKIPRGFVWDGCSIPKAVRPLMGNPFDSDLDDASLLHDYLYETHKATRARADEMFHAELLAAGVSAARAGLMYTAVRLFASSNYDDESKWSKFVPESQLVRWESDK